MKNFFYIKAFFDLKETPQKEVFSFLNQINSIKGVDFFYVFLGEQSFEVLKKMKNIQQSRNLKPTKEPIITNKEELTLANNKISGNNTILFLVIKNKKNIQEEVDEIIKNNNFIFNKIDKKNTTLDKIDVVTPLNMREDVDMVKLSFFISKQSLSLYDLFYKSKVNLPKIFYVFSVVFGIFKKFKKVDKLKEFVDDYYSYLLKYFRFDRNELQGLNKASIKYKSIINKILDDKYNFQKDESYIKENKKLYNNIVKNKNTFSKFNLKVCDNNKHWLLFHWLVNSFNIDFSHEIMLIFVLKNYYEKSK